MPDFSDKKFDYMSILNDMLKMVPNDLDKREGSVIWTTLAPNAMVLSQIYDVLKANQDNQYADTADRDSLIRLCKTRGIAPYPATPTEISANFYSDMVTLEPYNPTSGDTFYVQNTSIVFKVTTQIADGKWKLVCTAPGEVGNSATGRLIPTANMGNFAGAVIEKILVYGENEESTEDLRKRYKESFGTKAYSGNRIFYKTYTEGLTGVGGAKIYRAYQDKGGHVGVCITNSNGDVPSKQLLAYVKEQLDPVGYEGEGVGVAPMDHIVDVFGAVGKTLNIKLSLVVSKGTTWETVKPAVEASIKDYFKELSMDWANQEFIIVRSLKLQTHLLSIPEILDVRNCTINGSTGSVNLSDKEIPKLGTVTGAII